MGLTGPQVEEEQVEVDDGEVCMCRCVCYVERGVQDDWYICVYESEREGQEIDTHVCVRVSEREGPEVVCG